MKAFIAAIAGIFALVSTVWASVTILDTRYELKAVHQPQHEVIQSSMDAQAVSSIKNEIRAIRKELRAATDPDYRNYLQEELADAIDRLCRVSPNDRECS